MNVAELKESADKNGKAVVTVLKDVLSVNPQSSVELVRTRSGTYHWRIKLYFEDEASDNVVVRLEELDRELRSTFSTKGLTRAPRPEGR